MPPRLSTKRKSTEDDDDDWDNAPSSAPIGKSRPRRLAKRSGAQKLARINDSEDEAGGHGIYDREHWNKWQDSIKQKERKDSKKSTMAFETLAANQRKTALARLEKLENDLKKDQQRLESARSKSSALISHHAPDIPAVTSIATKPVSHRQPLFEMAEDQIARSQAMIIYYTGIDEIGRSESHRFEPPRASFMQDKEDLKLLISNGREVAESIIGGHLAPHMYTPLPTDKSQMSSYQQTAADMFKGSRNTIPEGFGTKLAEQIEGFTRLILGSSPRNSKL